MTSQAIEQKGGIGMKINENICRLFIQLRSLLTNPENMNEILSPASIFNELADICNDLIDRKYPIMDTFEILLNNYLFLIDTNEFVDILIHRYFLANNHFLSSFFHSFNSTDISDVFISMDGTSREKMYYRLLDQITLSTRILSFLNNDENFPQEIGNSCRIILLTIFRVLCYLQNVSINLSIIKLKKYEQLLFIPLLMFLEKYFSRNKNEILIKPILDFLQTTSKETVTIPIFINIKCPEVCLQWLSLGNFKSEEYECIINILNHISCHDEGISILNKYQCVQIFEQFKKDILFTKIDYIVDNSMYKNLLFMIHMITFSIRNSNEVESIDDYEIICNSLLPAIEIGLASPSFRYLGFYTSELLIILMKLFTNDNIVNYILQKYPISEFFVKALKKLLKNISIETAIIDKKMLSIIIFANIFWSISFQDRYRNTLVEHIKLITKLETLLINNIHLSRQIFSIKRAIDGIKQNLSPSKPPSIPTARSVMISYSYLDLEFYRKVYEILSKTSKVSIRMDADNWKQIAENIDQSHLILFLISKEFLMNKSCRQEFIYAIDILKKPCIAILIDREYPPTGWFNKRIDKLNSFHCEERDFIEELSSMINGILLMEENSSDIKQWDDKEVKQWFRNHHLIPELYEFYQFQNGNELFLYAQAISTCPWTKEYDRIRSRFEQKFHQEGKYLSPHEFSKFINALERVKCLI